MTKTLWTITSALLLCAGAASANSDLDFASALTPAKAAAALPAPKASIVASPGGESIVADRTTDVEVDLNAATVKCSSRDYQMPMLKVLVPGLAELTVLNHRNTAEGAPCIAAGRCTANLNPQSILKSGEGVETVPVHVTLKKIAQPDGQVCRVTLVETVESKIRGISFFHERRQEVADRDVADCR